MKKEDPEIVRTLREEECLGKLHDQSHGGEDSETLDEHEGDMSESLFTFLRRREEEKTKPNGLGDASEVYTAY